MNIVFRNVMGAAMFVVCSSAFFYGVEKFMGSSYFHKARQTEKSSSLGQIRFSVTNFLNEGIPNALIFVGGDSCITSMKEYKLTGYTGEVIIQNLPDGNYSWKVIAVDDTILSKSGRFLIKNHIPSNSTVSIKFGKVSGAFSNVSVKK